MDGFTAAEWMTAKPEVNAQLTLSGHSTQNPLPSAATPRTPARGAWYRMILLLARQIVMQRVVEAAGVEPASENVTGQETTCLFAFMPRALGVSTLPKTFAAVAQNGQETPTASLKILPSRPRRSRESQPSV
jgi:hypothetical protein